MATTSEVAKGLFELVQKGDFETPMKLYYSPNIVSTEAMGDPATVTGIDAVMGKAQWWMTNFEMHSCEVAGPFVCGDQFIVEYKLDATNRQNNERSVMHESALYTVAGGKIVDEKFFYGGM